MSLQDEVEEHRVLLPSLDKRLTMSKRDILASHHRVVYRPQELIKTDKNRR